MPRVFLAIGLATLLWATAARTGPVLSGGITTISGAQACVVADETSDRDSSRQWRNAHQSIAVVTESVWKSAPVHAGLGAIRVERLFELAGFATTPKPPAASTPHYLLHTPLLI